MTIPRLSSHLLLLLTLALLLFPARTAAISLSVTAPTRLTVNAGYETLLAWDETGIVARNSDSGVHTLLSAATGERAPCPANGCAATTLTAEVTVEGTTHRLFFDGALILKTEGEVLGRAALNADGSALVLARTPLGAETAALGELWRYDVAASRWTQLTRNGVEESAPLFSPDGRTIAFLRDGDVWLTPANTPTTESLTTVIPRPLRAPQGFDHVPPPVIRVIHVAASNNCRPGVPDGHIIELPFEEYIKRVVPHESPPSYPMEALKAQAIAARTYAWTYVLQAPDAPYHVEDTTRHQYMCDTTHPSTNAAVDATAGQHLTHNGALITSLFSAENASPTKQNQYGHVYLNAVDDPLSFGARRRGHGQGYSQVGAKRLAEAGWSYIDILLHYYSFTKVEPPAGNGDRLLDTSNRPPFAYVRGNTVLVELNAANVAGTQAREYRYVNGDWQVGDWQPDSDGNDGYRHRFPIASYSDMPLDDYRVEFAPIDSIRGGNIPVLFLGIDRTLPDLNVTFDVEGEITPGVPFEADLTLNSSDTGSGIAATGWTLPGWQEEAERDTDYATVFPDVSASGGAAIRYDPATHDAVTYSASPMAVTPGHYRVWVRLRTPEGEPEAEVATIRVFDDAGTRLQRGVRYIAAADFPPGGDWVWFHADVDATADYVGGASPYNAGALTLEVEWHGHQRLEIDEVRLATRESTSTASATITLTNPEPVRIYAADGAGNAAWRTCSTDFTPPPPPATRAAENYHLYLPLLRVAPPPPPPPTYEYTCR